MEIKFIRSIVSIVKVPTAETVQRTYITLLLFATLASSLIWGVNTLFLLDAGLNNTEAFAANAFFTAGQVLFEVPTGVVADTRGRRTSFLLGSITLSAATLLYVLLWTISAPFIWWAIVSVALGLGFTFFSGATEAWLVDALKYTKFSGKLEAVFAKGQVASGVAMLAGSVAGGFIAQATNLGIPFVVRAILLVCTFFIAYIFMRDLGFSPRASAHPVKEMKRVLNASIESGFKKPSVRLLMLSAPFTMGVSFYAFYALQPYLLILYGNEEAYGIAGLAAAIVASARIAGSMLVPTVRQYITRRTTALYSLLAIGGVSLIGVGVFHNIWAVLLLIVVWALVSAIAFPIRQTLINKLIPSSERATVLSFDSLMGSSGGVVIQPALGRAADVYSYPASFVWSGLIQFLAIPFLIAARKKNLPEDKE